MTFLQFALFKRCLMCGVAALALSAVPLSFGSVVSDVHFSQVDDGTRTDSEMYFYLKNNDYGVTYDRGELKFDELLDGVAQAVKDNNPAYSTNTLDEIKAEWNYMVAQGEVESGWSANLNNGIVDLTHMDGRPGTDYSVWKNSTDDPNHDTLNFWVDFGDQLDFNNNGLFDPDSEQLAQIDAVVHFAFIGDDPGNT